MARSTPVSARAVRSASHKGRRGWASPCAQARIATASARGTTGSCALFVVGFLGHRGMAGDRLYGARRTLHTGDDLLAEAQRARLTALFPIEEHVEVEATWGIYQRIIGAHRHPDQHRRKDHDARHHRHSQRRRTHSAEGPARLGRTLKELCRLGRTLTRLVAPRPNSYANESALARDGQCADCDCVLVIFNRLQISAVSGVNSSNCDSNWSPTSPGPKV